MAWSHHPGGRRYLRLYRGRREQRYSVYDHIGTGPLAEFLAGEEAQQQASQAARRAAEKHQQQDIQQAFRLTDRAFAAIQLVMKAELMAVGYHQHDRGEWRLKHGANRR